MTDLIVAAVVMTAAGFACGWAALCASKRCGRRGAILVVIVAVIGLLINGLVLYDSPNLVRFIPSSAVMVYGNLALPLTGLLIGGAWHSLKTPIGQRLTLLIPLALLGFQRSFWHVFRPPPVLSAPNWRDGICRQSTPSTCSAAAAATALHALGITVTEAEMANLCRTTAGGTSAVGLYRGLTLKTRGTRFELHLYRSVEDFWNRSTGPAVVNLRYVADDSGNPLFRLLGGRPGDGHSVVVLSRSEDGRLTIGDPLSGLQTWTPDELRSMWRGPAYALEPRR